MRDQQFQRVGNNRELHGQANEGLAIDLGVNRLVVERLAD